MKDSNLKFVFVCLVIFIAGGLLRLQSGWITISWLIRSSALPVRLDLDSEALAEMQATVLNFYNLVDKGRYAEAYQLGFENKWQKLASGEYRPVGLVPTEEFVDRLNQEIGSNGMGLNIISLEVMSQTVLSPDQWHVSDRPELQALNFIPDKVLTESIYEVEIEGVMLGRCSRWDWHDTVLVAHLNDGEWKLLLPGSPDDISPHYEEWFLDRNPFKGKRIAKAE